MDCSHLWCEVVALGATVFSETMRVLYGTVHFDGAVQTMGN